MNNRAKAIYELRKQGLTLEQIGNRFSVSRERVRQILQKLGPDPKPPKPPKSPKPARFCQHCEAEIIGKHLIKYCRTCSQEMKRYHYPFMSPEMKRKSQEASRKWQLAHPEQNKAILSRAHRKYYLAHKEEINALQRYQRRKLAKAIPSWGVLVKLLLRKLAKIPNGIWKEENDGIEPPIAT